MKSGPIVIVEDDPDDQEMLVLAFENIGVINEILLFSQAEKALQFLKTTNQRPFIIFSDINMPGMNGLELRRQVHADDELRRKSIPFVFLTTSATNSAVQEAYEMSVQGFFVKEHLFGGIKNQIEQIYSYWQSCKYPLS